MVPINYALWPTIDHLRGLLDGYGVTLRDDQDDAQLQLALDASVKFVERRTRRQFLASTGLELRYYDGSGTGEQEVDEYVSLADTTDLAKTAPVVIYGWVGGVGSSLTQVVERHQNLCPKTVIEISRGSMPPFSRLWLDRFPAGRQNIGVSAIWGYASTIPADLWQAVLKESARAIVNANLFSVAGRRLEAAEADVKEKYALLDGSYLAPREEFEAVVDTYRRPLSRRLRAAHAPMI